MMKLILNPVDGFDYKKTAKNYFPKHIKELLKIDSIYLVANQQRYRADGYNWHKLKHGTCDIDRIEEF